MLQKITGYHLDSESHWVAELGCGHAQHVRHDPPWTLREWVTTAEGRNSRLGQELNCVRCDEIVANVVPVILQAVKTDLQEAYTDAGLSGLCDEGRWEAALGALQGAKLEKVAREALENWPT
jgi:hypothetical protein